MRGFRRRLVFVLRIVAVLAVVALSVYAVRWIEHYVRTSPTFAIQDIEVTGNTRLQEAEVLDRAKLALGNNVFDQPVKDIEASLEGDPWIASARVRRSLPGSIEIELREYLPVAILFLQRDDGVAASGLLVGDEGTVFKTLGPSDPADLPVITGMSAIQYLSDDHQRTSILLSTVALLHAWRASGLWRRSPISEIHVEGEGGLSVYTGEPLVFIKIGTAPYLKKLRRLRRIFDRLDKAKTPPAYVYLDNVRRPDRVTLKLRPLPETLPWPPELAGLQAGGGNR